VFTVGHGTLSEAQLLDRLRPGAVTLVVDIRRAPGSRRHPHLGKDQLEQWLPAAGIAYRWEPRLGGFRPPAPDSPDTFWRNDSFRGYAAHLRSDEARAAVHELLLDAAARSTAFMCSETLWWRCHRRLVADVLALVHGVDVCHLMTGPAAAHPPSPGARRVGDVLVYDRS
jgi:uncharacterized protein (DUF488 family)